MPTHSLPKKEIEFISIEIKQLLEEIFINLRRPEVNEFIPGVFTRNKKVNKTRVLTLTNL